MLDRADYNRMKMGAVGAVVGMVIAPWSADTGLPGSHQVLAGADRDVPAAKPM
jgi:hypothetical protein